MPQVPCRRCGVPLRFTVQSRTRFTMIYDLAFTTGCQDAAEKLKEAGGEAVSVDGCADAARSISAWIDSNLR
jgi:hypothetical protein